MAPGAAQDGKNILEALRRETMSGPFLSAPARLSRLADDYSVWPTQSLSLEPN
jgi:hypothetical protein